MRFAQLFSRLMLLFQEKEFWGKALDNLLWLITVWSGSLALAFSAVLLATRQRISLSTLGQGNLKDSDGELLTGISHTSSWE